MENEATQAHFPVDLSQEEYVRSQELLSQKFNGRRVGGSRLFSLLMMLLCLVSAVAVYRQTGTPDWAFLSLLVLMFVSEIWMMIDLPKQMRRRHSEAYAATQYTGYSFKGTVWIEEGAVRKQTESATATIPYENCRIFVETSDMMIFCGVDGHSIVIPARFLTEETAEITRQAAIKNIPPSRRLLLSRLVPAVLPPIETEETEEETRLTVLLEYTEKEVIGMALDSALFHFARTLSGKCLLCTMLAAVAYFCFFLPPLPVFLLALLLFLGGSAFLAYRKIHRTIKATDKEICRMRLNITTRGLRLEGRAEGAKPMVLPWKAITRAVERRDTVEFYTGKEVQLMIPKRCVPDMEELRRTVDSLLV